jgi:hypothetical protein
VDFSAADLDAAWVCTEWLVKRIASGVFWPPAEKVLYDDFEVLTAGRTLLEMVAPPERWRILPTPDTP